MRGEGRYDGSEVICKTIVEAWDLCPHMFHRQPDGDSIRESFCDSFRRSCASCNRHSDLRVLKACTVVRRIRQTMLTLGHISREALALLDEPLAHSAGFVCSITPPCLSLGPIFWSSSYFPGERQRQSARCPRRSSRPGLRLVRSRDRGTTPQRRERERLAGYWVPPGKIPCKVGESRRRAGCARVGRDAQEDGLENEEETQDP